MNRLSDKTYQEYYSELFNELKIKIAQEQDDYIISNPTEDLVKYYLNNALQPIEFDDSREEKMSHDKSVETIYAHEREWGYQQDGDLKVETEKIIVKLPIIPNSKVDQILRLRTNSISMSPKPEIDIRGSYVVIELEIKGYGKNLDDAEIAQRINGIKSTIQGMLSSKNTEINSENKKLEQNLVQFIDQRKQKLDSDKSRLSNLMKLTKIPLERKDSDTVKKIQIDTKPFVKKIKPKTPEEDYQLDHDKVVDIIRLMDNQSLQFEKTPKTYDNLGEENLRDLLLANLNSVFEGKATGETFNNKGKSDIYLNIDKGNILVSECKFYGGEKLYQDTIDQLLGYLTWRQNYGIMITFSKNKDFTKVIEDADSIITSHSTYQSGFKKLGDSHFISKHTLPTDDYKYVEIHHLYYNLFCK
jgi:hypothetical protein